MGWRNYGRGITETCYECPDRYPACHDHCERYINAKKEWFEMQKTSREAKEKYLISYVQHVEAVRKTTKKRR